MKINKYSVFLLLVMTIFLLGITVTPVSAAAKIVNLTMAYGNETIQNLTALGGTDYFLNATVENFAKEVSINCSFYVGSASTANTSWTIIGSATNLSDTEATIHNISTTFQVDSIEDANDYIFNATCFHLNETIATGNASSNISSANNVVDVDSPDTPSSLSPTDNNIDTDGDVTFSATVNGSETTFCTLRFEGVNPGQGTNQSMTHSGNTCTKSLTSVPEGSYRWFVTASDGRNITNSATQTQAIDISTGAGKSMTPEQVAAFQAEEERQPLSIAFGDTEVPVWLIVVLVIAVVGIIWYVKNK